MFGPDYVPGVFLKVLNCEPELLNRLAELFNMCLKESYFQDCWKVSSVVLVFKNPGERSTVKNYCPVCLFSVISKVFQIFVKIRLLITWRNVAFSLTSSMVLGLLD